jgi:cytochrome oxidase Cu insertion factor (SCO1/SenC/PrrC family)
MERTTKPLFRVLVYLVLIVAIGWTLRLQLRQLSAKTQSRVAYKTRAGEKLPDFEVQDLSGKVWRSADLKGKVAYINVWASW